MLETTESKERETENHNNLHHLNHGSSHSRNNHQIQTKQKRERENPMEYLTQEQIQEFTEAFKVFDQKNHGYIAHEDLAAVSVIIQ